MYDQGEHFLCVSGEFGSSTAQLCNQDLATMASHNPLHNLCEDQAVEYV
jgi:hypothetical protein